MGTREFSLTAVMPKLKLVQVFSYSSGKHYNPVLYEKTGVLGFDFKGKWHVLSEHIEEDTRINNWPYARD